MAENMSDFAAAVDERVAKKAAEGAVEAVAEAAAVDGAEVADLDDVTETTATTSLRLKFKDVYDKSASFSYSPAKASAGAAAVKALMQGMIDDASVFESAPATMVSAAFVTTTTVPVDLS